MDPRTAFRKGKLEELSACAKAVNADLIIFANDLSSASVQRIRYETGIEVRDRTALILDIFANRAKSRQAKIQVEAAQLKYDLPRLSTNADHETHIRGGSYRNRGSGELAVMCWPGSIVQGSRNSTGNFQGLNVIPAMRK